MQPSTIETADTYTHTTVRWTTFVHQWHCIVTLLCTGTQGRLVRYNAETQRTHSFLLSTILFTRIARCWLYKEHTPREKVHQTAIVTICSVMHNFIHVHTHTHTHKHTHTTHTHTNTHTPHTHTHTHKHTHKHTVRNSCIIYTIQRWAAQLILQECNWLPLQPLSSCRLTFEVGPQ